MATKYKCNRIQIDPVPGSVSGAVTIKVTLTDPTTIPPDVLSFDIPSNQADVQDPIDVEQEVDAFLAAIPLDNVNWTL